MAASSNNAVHGAPEGEVSNCVLNLIHAFTNGLDIFKRLRERRRKRKSRKHGNHTEQSSGAELQLSNSLRRGPMDIQRSYADHYSKAGDRFAKGDAIAHASLAKTLINLNTGLVSIITAFLNHDSKSNRLDLDYKSLTNLSNASRLRAVESLNELYERTNQSQMQVYRIGGCPKCGSMKHQNCSGGHRSEKGQTTGGSHSRARSNGPTITRIPVKSSSQTKLAVVRPRNGRKSSSSSSSSAKSHSTPVSSPYTSPLGSPLPQYAPKDPFPPQKPTSKVSPPTGRRGAGSFDGPRPTTWPHTRPDINVPLQPPPPQGLKPKQNHSSREKHTPSPGGGPIKRRMDKPTPSTYTFASDSTKIGEIPQRNWATPYNYAEAERLNAEALVNGYPTPAVENKPKARKGLFKFLRRGAAAS